LFNGLGAGLSLKASFEKAVVQAETHTDSGTNTVSAVYNDRARQHPLLDDNGDAKGSNALSGTGEGAASEGIVLGTGGTAETGMSAVTKAGTVPETPPALDASVSRAGL